MAAMILHAYIDTKTPYSTWCVQCLPHAAITSSLACKHWPMVRLTLLFCLPLPCLLLTWTLALVLPPLPPPQPLQHLGHLPSHLPCPHHRHPLVIGLRLCKYSSAFTPLTEFQPCKYIHGTCKSVADFTCTHLGPSSLCIFILIECIIYLLSPSPCFLTQQQETNHPPAPPQLLLRHPPLQGLPHCPIAPELYPR